MKKHMLYTFILLSLLYCKKEETSSVNTNEITNTAETIYDINNNAHFTEDGTYCADITYYNPNTGTESQYTLNVQVKNGMLTKIYWNNGGWLDESHFTPQDITDGHCEFISDKGYTYNVSLNYIGQCKDNDYISPSNTFEQEQSNEDKYEGVYGTVIWESSSCDYVVIYTENGWYVIAEKFSGAYSLSVDDKVKGDLDSFGFKDIYCINRDREMRVYVDNYYATQSLATEKLSEKCN